MKLTIWPLGYLDNKCSKYDWDRFSSFWDIASRSQKSGGAFIQAGAFFRHNRVYIDGHHDDFSGIIKWQCSDRRGGYLHHHTYHNIQAMSAQSDNAILEYFDHSIVVMIMTDWNRDGADYYPIVNAWCACVKPSIVIRMKKIGLCHRFSGYQYKIVDIMFIM